MLSRGIGNSETVGVSGKLRVAGQRRCEQRDGDETDAVAQIGRRAGDQQLAVVRSTHRARASHRSWSPTQLEIERAVQVAAQGFLEGRRPVLRRLLDEPSGKGQERARYGYVHGHD